MDDLELDNPAWRFAVRLYGEPGIAAEFLRLQDERGIDVVLLLVCLWLGQERGIALDRSAFAEAEALAGEWSRIAVAPLRAARRGVKLSPLLRNPAVVSFRAKVQAIEIEAERIEIALLHAWAAGRDWPSGRPERSRMALRNLRTVLSARGAAGGDHSALKSALAAATAAAVADAGVPPDAGEGDPR